MKNRSMGCNTLIFLFIFGMGAAWLYITYNNMQMAEASQKWPSTSGEVTGTWVEEEESTDEDGFTDYDYYAYISYFYMVDDQPFSGQRVDFGSRKSYSSYSRAQEYLDQYPVGRQVEVFYDPADPAEAVLIREASGSTFGLIGGVVMALGSIAGWIGSFIKSRRSIL